MRLWPLAVSLLLLGCPKEEAAPPADNRLIEKMKAEQERLRQGGQPGAPPVVLTDEDDPLVQAAAGGDALLLHAVDPSAKVEKGGVAAALSGLESGPTVKGKSLSLSTADLFIKVTVEVATQAEAKLDVGAAKLKLGEERFDIARDVQRAAPGSPMEVTLGKQPQRLTFYFEAPRGTVQKGLSLVLTFPSGELELPLQ